MSVERAIQPMLKHRGPGPRGARDMDDKKEIERKKGPIIHRILTPRPQRASVSREPQIQRGIESAGARVLEWPNYGGHTISKGPVYGWPGDRKDPGHIKGPGVRGPDTRRPGTRGTAAGWDKSGGGTRDLKVYHMIRITPIIRWVLTYGR